MDPKELISTINDSKEIIFWIAPIALSAILFIYIKSRAGSAHFIRNRIWGILGGKESYEDPELQQESLKLADHEKFNYNTGIRFPSHESIKKTLAWLRSTGIGLEELARITPYFNTKEIEIKKPRIKSIKHIYQLSFITFLFSSLVLLLSITPAALLKIKKTETRILAYENQSRATSWNIFSWSITESDCIQSKSDPDIDDYDKKIICELLLSKDQGKLIGNAIFAQRIAALIFTIMITVWMFLAEHKFNQAKEAIILRDRSRQGLNPGTEQPSQGQAE